MMDLVVIGGGINGVGIAAEAAARGLSVTLLEAGDLGGRTSSGSSKLAHGGLRYLESYHFKLVGEALKERDVLLARAPHIVRPMRFVLPHVPAMRPAWMVRAGLVLYDHLWRSRVLPKARRLDLRRDRRGEPLTPDLHTGFAYSDGFVDDARLVIANALFAHRHGAVIRPRTRFLGARPEGEGWAVRLRAEADGPEQTITCRALVNAAGPWVRDVMDAVTVPSGETPARPRPGVRLVRGSHIVVPRLHAGDHAYTLQNDDGRVVFVIPYEGQFSLIGTTDVVHDGDPAEVAATSAEVDYLVRAVGRFFPRPLDLPPVWSWAAVRPLYDDGDADPSAITREYVLHMEPRQVRPGAPALLSVFGGKLTTYRSLADKALARLEPLFPGLAPSPTAALTLPGGDLPGGDPDAFAGALARVHPDVAWPLLRGLVARHGTGAAGILRDGLGRTLGGGLTEGEVDYLRRAEWAVTAEDILWRRTKAGLHMSPVERAVVGQTLNA